MQSKMRLLAASVAVLSVAMSQAMFTNGDFETGDLTGWTVGLTPNGATVVQDVQVFETVLGTPSNAGHFRVGQAVFTSGVQEGINLTQRLTLTGGVTYDLYFDVAANNTGTGGNSSGGVFTAIVDGAFVGSSWNSGSISGLTTLRNSVTGSFTPNTTGLYEVGIRITRPFTTGASGLNQYVDNASVSAVPEPATMLALGAGLLALARRRK
ncbi:MAG: PEP-CTERM sorting domain-containing protein [Fimbriimonadaceae bacterium]|nr:PEP-CTERM sorting domain-containing protein [Fimbriimonadaceae bacterium]